MDDKADINQRDSDGSRPECLYICLPDYPQAPGEGNAGGGAGGKQVHFLPEAPSQETPHAGALPPANSKLPQGVLAEAPTKNPDGVLAEAHSKHSVATSYGSIDCIPGHISKGLTMNAYSLLYVYLLHTTLLQQQEQEQLEQQRQQQGGRTASGKRLKPPQRRRLFPWYNWIFLPAGLFMQVMLPVTMLVEWLTGDSSFVDLFEPVVVFKDTRIDRVGTALRISQGVIAVYVLVIIARTDLQALWQLMRCMLGLDAQHLWLAVAKAVLITVYLTVIVLVPLCCFIVTARCTSPSEVILSGVGALFILEIDDFMFEAVGCSEDVFQAVVEVANAANRRAVRAFRHSPSPWARHVPSAIRTGLLAIYFLAMTALTALCGYVLYRINGQDTRSG